VRELVQVRAQGIWPPDKAKDESDGKSILDVDEMAVF
jgi:hypothetical protein